MALLLACNSIDQFKKFEKLDDSSSGNIIGSLKQFEQQLQTNLRHLIKVSMNKQCDQAMISRYKRLYSLTLQSPANKDNFVIFAKHLSDILIEVQATVSDLKEISTKNT